MARQVLTTSPFIGGLNTEVNELTDAPQYTKDECNCTIRANGSRSRRLGIDYEEQYKFLNATIIDSENDVAFSCTEWTDISNGQNTSYIVVQCGGTLYFFENLGQPFSQKEATYSLDMLQYSLNNSYDYQKTPVSFTTAYGGLFVCSKAIKPFMLTSLDNAEKEPDWQDQPATCSISTQSVNGVEGRAKNCYFYFYLEDVLVAQYNALGYSEKQPSSKWLAKVWNAADATLRQNITATAISPYDFENNVWFKHGDSQPEYVVFTAPLGVSYVNKKITIKCVYTKDNRTNKDGQVWERSARLGGYVQYTHKRGLTLTIRDFKGLDDGLNLGDAIQSMPTTLSTEHKYNLLNQGWTEDKITAFYQAQQPNQYPSNAMAWHYAKDAETNEFKPLDLLKIAFGNTPAPKGHYLLEYFKQNRSGISGIAGIPIEYPRYDTVTDIIAYAGRIFYLVGDTVLYSQIIAENIDNADKCYQDADPTSEELSDLIETDGGMIQMPELGEGIKFALIGAALAVVGTKGIQLISGGTENVFSATAYTRGALQSFTTISPLSFVATEYGVFFWGTTGICNLAYNSGDYGVQNITETTIQTFYNKIPDWSRENCRGIYNSAKKEIVWLYPGDENNPRRLNKYLNLHLTDSTWTTGEFYDVEDLSPAVVGGISLQNSFKLNHIYPLVATNAEGEYDSVAVNGTRILVASPLDSEVLSYEAMMYLCFDENNKKITFGNLVNNNYVDWISGDIHGIGYSFPSYIVSHPIVAGDSLRAKTMPYIITTFRRTEQGETLNKKYIYGSRCQGSVLWDWNVDGDSGKWDARQELYRPNKNTIFSDQFIISRTRVYGSGRAIQVKLESVGNQNFIIESIGFDLFGDSRVED